MAARTTSKKKSPSPASFRLKRMAALIPSFATARNGFIFAASIFAVGGLGFAALTGAPKLRAWAEARAVVDPARVRVRFDSTPSWIPASSLDQLTADAREALDGASSLDGSALENVHRRMFASGWFDRVEQVRRTASDEIEITAEFLVPFALVHAADAYYVVDLRGRRLPLCYSENSELPKLPLVAGFSMPKPAEAGAAWIGQDVRAALKLASLINKKPWFAAGQVAKIDASRFTRESILELVTDHNTRITWGADPDSRSLGEMPTDRKLARLDALWANTKRIDSGTGRVLDLRFDVVTLAPAETADSASSSAPSTPVSAHR